MAGLESRIARLEQYRKPPRQWLYHVSDPPTAAEQAAIASATGAIVIVPHPCETIEEWEAATAHLRATA